MILSIPLPSLDSSTLAGAFQWFLFGFGAACVPASIALMIRLFRKSAGVSTHDI
jgi:hypothetical protein